MTRTAPLQHLEAQRSEARSRPVVSCGRPRDDCGVERVQESLRILGDDLGERRSRIEFELRGAGHSFPFFFRSPEPVLAASGDAYLACALLPAMRAGVELDLGGAVSARVLSALPRILDIYRTWDPKLERVSLEGLVPVERTRAPSGRVGAFFSGGVDSFYSLIKHRDEITDLIFVHGFDIPHDNEERFRLACSGVEEAASDFGLGVVHVQTNLKVALDTFVGWGPLGHGAGLFAIGHLLASAFDRIYIPSTGSYAQLAQWGSHPLLDPLWSSEALEFVHDGCEANRVEKVQSIAGSDTALRHLRVCHETFEGEYNCSRCEKCLRTMVNLELAGKLEQCRTFDKPLDARSIRWLDVWASERGYYEENLAVLKERGIRPDLQRALAYVLWRPGWLNGRRLLRLLRLGP
jgi:hypothetical protein